jgi:dihydropyrimidine dehydrogenase (NAD+) subunit PreA
MADLSCNLAGIKSPNPFWVASGPPCNTGYQAHRAFEAGWGGVVWKTIGTPIVNVASRYSALNYGKDRMIGLNNIELISDRAPETNFKEITEVKKRWPHHAVIASLMVETREQWHEFVKRAADAGADGIELNYGCPHGMCERGMGAAVGQQPAVIEKITSWVMEAATIPVIVKLTPNITDIRYPARAAKQGGADAVSLINTLNSITNVNLETFSPEPSIDGKGSHGGYCGPAVKPIALSMVSEIARDRECRGLPISGIGGITTWRDAAEFFALGAGNVQVCTAAMTYGFRIVEEMKAGLSRYLDERRMSLSDLVGRAAPNISDWQYLNLNYVTKARINQDLCIECGRCHVVCEDTAHQAITATKDGRRHFEVVDAECVGCNLCVNVCPVENCITMEQLTTGVDPHTGAPATGYMNWTEHPNNPMAKPAASRPAPLVPEPAE